MNVTSRRSSIFLPVLLAMGISLVAPGCGSILYGHWILKADKAIAQAKVNDAEEFAPYEYTFAVEHQKKAKEEVGYSDFQAAVECAKVATEYGLKAKEIARKQKMEAGR